MDAGARAGLPRSQRLGGVATYRAVLQASRNPELFSNTGGTRPDHEPIVPAMIDMDDPLHLQRRKLVNTGFAPAGP